jgi:group II intron reverse transcriptase/maturase
MVSDYVNRRLEAIEKISKQGGRVNKLHDLLSKKEIWLQAYAKIYVNQGALTKGINNNTLDGFSEERIETLIKLLKEDLFRPKPVRRVYIPKTKTKFRPLGLPTGDDKLVQEGVRIILERIYEPVFLDWSHGFRPKRSCHTALMQLKRTWQGMKWILEFDIKGCFDNIDHRILIELLEKKIDDRKFINLIRNMLRAGYMEDWTYHKTYSGTPQGGIVSPLLANIYLHELDCFVDSLKKNFDKGQQRRMNPEYARYLRAIHQLRKQIDRIKEIEGKESPKIPEIRSKIKELDKTRKTISYGDPYDEKFRRLSYCRYADDFVLGVIGSKRDAVEIMEQVKAFINQTLNLQIAEDKTGIKYAEEGITFLGCNVGVYSTDKVIKAKVAGRYTRKRTVSEVLRLTVPFKKVEQFCQGNGYGDHNTMKTIHRAELMNLSEAEIISTYNAELRGFANYYALASDVKYKLNKLQYMVQDSLFKTLAAKYKTSKSEIMAKLRQGEDYVLKYGVRGKTKILKVYKLKDLKRQSINWKEVDILPNIHRFTQSRNELIQRLNAERCEYCRRSDKVVRCEVHHVRKLADLKKKKNLELWEKVMISRQRKTLVLCSECHDLLHSGKLPDWRYSLWGVESRTP